MTSTDFGFNFDTVVNTNDSGQGSLRSFFVNANALTNAGLAQAGQTAGRETSIFMVSDGAAHAGLRAGLPNLLTGGVAVIAPTTLLPSITDPDTTLDGTTQTTNVGNTNAGTLGAGGSVGVDALALAPVERPEVEIRDGAALTRGLHLSAANGTVRGVSVWGFGNTPAASEANVRIDGSGAVVERCVLGSPATSFADPGAATRSRGANVGSAIANNVTVQDNLIGFTADSGVSANGVVTGWLIRRNEIRGNAIGTGNMDGVHLQGGASASTVQQNLIVDNEGCGIDMFNAAGSVTILDNTVTGSGVSPGGSTETAGIRVWGTGSVVDRNIIHDNFGAGILVTATAAANRLTRNSVYDNGAGLNLSGAGPTGQIGIDLLSAGDDASRGTAPYVTLNDAGDGDSGANALTNYPVITFAALIGSTLHVSGFTRPGTTVEIFLSDPDPTGFGEGRTFLFSGVEGSGADTDPGSGTYGPAVVNGIAQGTDTTNRFAFSFVPPVAVSVGAFVTATATDASNATSEFGGGSPVTSLRVVKRAYSTGGTPIPDASLVPKGTLVRFLLYVNNVGGPVSDVTLQDVLAPAFQFVTGSIRFSNATARCLDQTCTTAEENAIFAGAVAGTVGTDATGDDVASFAASTLHAGNQNAANAQLDIASARVWAVVFTVKMQ